MTALDQADVVIRRRDGKFFASIPQLSLYAKGESVEAALAALETKKAALAADLAEVGELDTLDIAPLGYGAGTTAAPVPGSVRGFAIKTAIVAIAIAAVLVVSGVFVASGLQAVVNDVKKIKIGGEPFWAHVEEEVDRMASSQSDLPEAKKQKLLADIRAIGVKWRPFVTEIRSALTGSDTQAPRLDQPSDK
jgi:hypothetical protein